VRGFVTAPTDAASGPGLGTARLFELGRHAVANAGVEWTEVAGVGIGCGGPLDSDGGILIAPLHLHGWTGVPIAELAVAEYDRPAVVDNDATAAAAVEHSHRAAA